MPDYEAMEGKMIETQSMVERVALEIQRAYSGDEWQSASSSHGAWCNVARVAIAAMQAVTKEMVEAGGTALDNAIDSDWDSGPDGMGHNEYTTIRSGAQTEVFRAMIDAALKD